MSLADIIILSIALGIDCLVVSFSQGLIFKSDRVKNSLFLALTMGFCQGLMPCFSYGGTSFIDKYIEPYSSIIVFAIFLFLGIKFISGAFTENNEKLCSLNWKCLMALGIATSIDALASGISIRLTETPLIKSVIIIGLMSFLMSIIGFWTGNFFKKLPSKALEIFGGIILICLAVKSMPIF